MKKRIFLILKLISFPFLFIILYKTFAPTYYVIPPLEKRANTKYIKLSTGSIIGYTKLEGVGEKKAYPIIYLHGGPGGFISDKIIKILSNFANDGYDIFLYDQIGSGESDRLTNIRDYTVNRHVSDLHEIVNSIGTKKVILMGQSWGSVLASYYVSDYPGEIEKLIFINPGPLYPYTKELNEIKAPDSLHLHPPIFTNAQGNAKVKNLRTMAVKYFATHFGIKLASDKEADEFSTYSSYEINKSTVYDTAKAIKFSEVKSTPRSGYYAEIMTFQNLLNEIDPRPKLKGLEIPILVLKSQYDNQIWGGTNEYLDIFKNHHLEVIPNAGHFITIEQPELFLKTIRHFLSN